MRPTLDSTLDLNPEQRAAVEQPDGRVLVIAGAGSGKTRVLTARVARLLERGTPPGAILAFTFTNRAAREMRERIARAVGSELAVPLWVGTFHATGVRILRREAARLSLPADFTIYDREDQEDVVRDVLRRLGLPDSLRPAAVLAGISDAKNALLGPEAAARLAAGAREKQIAEAYAVYQQELRRCGALDFDDLIVEVVRLFGERLEVAERWSRRFEHVLVDEYQDTNHAQFRLIEALAAGHGRLFVVGDDDQSIYGWRGADLANVLDFELAFPGAAVLRLEQNYRSTGNILKAANAVIANNRARKGKTLWCEREEGPRLRFALAADEAGEARRIRRFLEQRRRAGGRYDDCAVLYRTNAQSRALETELRAAGIPYELVGGVAFYQRREVKDLLAYLRLVVNPLDAAAFWRIWNTPRRGLGEAVRRTLEERTTFVPQAGPRAILETLLREGTLARGPAAGAASFLGLIRELEAMRAGPVDELFAVLLRRSGYLEYLDEEPESAPERRANVEELAAAIAGFARPGDGPGREAAPDPGPAADGHPAGAPPAPAGTLADFLAEAALVSDVDRLEAGADRVLLLTAHNAKGLEFPVVVVAGLEEGMFPHANATGEDRELEEERRLFYVALTRARDQVLLTAAAYRRRLLPGGGTMASGGRVSRFVDEIPAELLERETAAAWSGDAAGGGPWRRGRIGSLPTAADGSSSAAAAGRPRSPLGREVFHEQFGRGVVLDVDGAGADLKFTVRFAAGVKKVLGRFLTAGGGDDPA